MHSLLPTPASAPGIEHPWVTSSPAILHRLCACQVLYASPALSDCMLEGVALPQTSGSEIRTVDWIKHSPMPHQPPTRICCSTEPTCEDASSSLFRANRFCLFAADDLLVHPTTTRARYIYPNADGRNERVAIIFDRTVNIPGRSLGCMSRVHRSRGIDT